VFEPLSKKQFEAQLAALERLRDSADPAAELRKALRNRNNYLASKAARLTGDLGLTLLVPDLVEAFDRFLGAGADPQCWAKNALVDALFQLGHGDSALYLRGLKHVQMEPVWGKQVDTAGPLRGRCALALVQCKELSDLKVLEFLIEVLVDSDKSVRVEAARAIGRIDRTEAALLLRLKALSGDEEPEVMGACFSALLALESRGGFAFVGRFLERGDDAAAEAAIALGLTHEAEAFSILRNSWERERRNPTLVTALLSAMALTGLPEALDFLLGLIANGSAGALEALSSARLTAEDRDRVNSAIDSSGSAELKTRWARMVRFDQA
jgi:HEAT repeat protein